MSDGARRSNLEFALAIMASFLIGLTGGMACGKSASLRLFAALGWRTLDADAICAGFYADPAHELPRAALSRWGDRITDAGVLDKRKIAAIVFNAPDELDWLDRTARPLVLKEAERRLDGMDGPVIFEVPLLYEAGWEGKFASVVAVWSPRDAQVERLRGKGWTQAEIDMRLARQLPPEMKLGRADFALINSMDMEFLKQQCVQISKSIEGIIDGEPD